MKRYIIIIVLLIILGLGVYVGIEYVGGEDVSIKKISNAKDTYEEYKVGDLVSFKDEEWYVMYDSDKDTDYVTLISSNILSLDELGIDTVVKGIYETSDINKYLKEEYAKELGEENLFEKNGYKVRLFNKEDLDFLIDSESITYDEDNDEYIISECPEFVCLTNTFYATMIDTNDSVELYDVYYNVDDVEDMKYEDYTLHLKYYNITSTYDTYKVNSLVNDTTLFVRPVINVYKKSLE